MEERIYNIEEIDNNAVNEIQEEGNEVTVSDSKNENTNSDSSTEMSDNKCDDVELEKRKQELLELISNPRIMRAYRKAIGGNSHQVSKNEKKKKKAKRRMSNKSKKR
jgi:hypothetical protein